MLVRSRVLDVMGRTPVIVFDKTGTLTAGRPTILETTVVDRGEGRSSAQLLALAAAIETASEHVLARAFAACFVAGEHEVEDIVATAGAGVEATVDGQRYRIGSEKFARDFATVDSPALRGQGTHVYLAAETGLLARFDIGDELRTDALPAVRELQAAGFRLVIASGDQPEVVASIARKLGIGEWHAAVSPQGKVALVKGLQASGEEVVMIGDGINDAPVLSAANASIAIDAGTALARASADAIVLGKRLTSVADAAAIARATRAIIRQNIGWAIGYNIVAVPLAATGNLAPWMAAIGMSVSSLIVVANALRLQRVSPGLATGKATTRDEKPREVAS